MTATLAERLLTVRELADVLGIAPATLLDWCERKPPEVPHFKIGRAIRFRESEVLTWLESCRRGPAPVRRPLEVVG